MHIEYEYVNPCPPIKSAKFTVWGGANMTITKYGEGIVIESDCTIATLSKEDTEQLAELLQKFINR